MSKVLGKRRNRPDDPVLEDLVQHAYSNFRPMTVLVPCALHDEVGFLSGRRIEGEPVQRVLVQIKYNTARPKPGQAVFAKYAVVIDLDMKGTTYLDIHEPNNPYSVYVKDVMDCMPLCATFLLGMLPRIGRKDFIWIDVDEDTRKRVRSPPESSVHRAFVQHTLGERELVREIFSFLC